ncbi:hypothetical protein F5X99DRAFT_287347 [Biscogniauxia marginata]|nr:hypothetical protein F5X99DRAFT_287347 [Biscogniauxia marginata]
MNNFGVIELASTKTTNAPGWAYVPDTGPLHQPAQPTNRKRARGGNQAGGAGGALSSADASARQEAKTRKEIEVLDRDNHRDVHIAIPPKPQRSQQHQRKHTPNVRRILQSQKTFANHLDDFVALEAANPNPATASGAASAAGTIVNAAAAIVPATSSRAAASAANANLKKSRSETAAASSSSRAASASTPKANTIKQEDVEMADAPEPSADVGSSRRSTILTPYTRPPPPQPQPQPQQQDQDQDKPQQSLPANTTTTNKDDDDNDDDNDNINDTDNLLLASRVPPLPTDAELRALLSAPPLSYLEVRALSAPPPSSSSSPRYPARVFCAVCGYWGRVRCTRCGSRVCALDCLEAHRDDCVTRYGL